MRRRWLGFLDWVNRHFVPPGFADTEHVLRYDRRTDVEETDFEAVNPVDGMTTLAKADAVGAIDTRRATDIVSRLRTDMHVGEALDVLDEFRKTCRMDGELYRERALKQQGRRLLSGYSDDEIRRELYDRLVRAEQEQLGLNNAFRKMDAESGRHAIRFRMSNTDDAMLSMSDESMAIPEPTFKEKEVDIKVLRVGFDLLGSRTVDEQVRSYVHEKAKQMDLPENYRVDLDLAGHPTIDRIVDEGRYKVFERNYSPDVVIAPENLRGTFEMSDRSLRLDDINAPLTMHGMDVHFDDTGVMTGGVLVVDRNCFGYEVVADELQATKTGQEHGFKYGFQWRGNYVTLDSDAAIRIDLR